MSAGEPAAPRFGRLLPPTDAPAPLSAGDVLAGWPPKGEPRRRLAVNMVASVDGKIAVAGRSAPLGSPADRALFHALRARADAVLVSAGTVRSERYGRLIKDPQIGERRRREGLARSPLAVIASRSLDLDPGLPLFEDPDAQVVILTPSRDELAPCAARVDYVRSATLRAGIEELRARWNAELILCEGGPSLNGSLVAESLIDELFLTIAPLLVGDTPDGGALISNGVPPSPQALRLATLLEADGQLYAHYVSSA